MKPKLVSGCFECGYAAKRIEWAWICDCRSCINYGKQLGHLLMEAK